MIDGTLAREWLLFYRSPLPWVVLTILSLLMAAAALNGANRIALQEQNVTQANSKESEMLSVIISALKAFESRGQAEAPAPAFADPGAVGLSILSHYAAMQPAPLAAFAIGQSDLNPYYYRITAGGGLSFLGDFELQNPRAMQIGHFDIAFLVIYLLPVFILILSYDILSTEKEKGILALALSQPVSLHAFVNSKIWWRACFLLIAIGLLGLLCALVAGADVLGVETWIGFGLWAGVVCLYALFWFTLAVLINAYGRSSASNGVFLAASWLLLVIIVPSLVSLTATTLYPAPSRVMLAAEMREASAAADAAAAEALEDFYFDHPEFGAPNPGARSNFFLQTISKEASIEKAVAPLLGEFESQADAQRQSVEQLQYLSPAIMAQQALNKISGTDYLRFNDFKNQVNRFHEAWADFFVGRLINNQQLTASDMERLPMFNYRSPPPDIMIGDVLRSAVGLLVLVIVLGLWARVKLRRFPIVG